MPSRPEIKIAEILTMNGIKFEQEYSFPDLKTKKGRLLRFDFAVFDDDDAIDFLIEYQGIQHYTPKDAFGGAKGFKKQQYNDTQKRIYCNRNNLLLVAIPYWDEHKLNYDYIMRMAGY